MRRPKNRRSFLKQVAMGTAGIASLKGSFAGPQTAGPQEKLGKKTDTGDHPDHRFNSTYTNAHLNRVAFPIGGIGAGMFCLEGTGAISHMSIQNHPEVFHEPGLFAAISIPGLKNGAKLLEGPVPDWKFFGSPGTGNGASGTTYGLPRFSHAEFEARFPFATVRLRDEDLPVTAEIRGWSPFIPLDEDSSSLPLGGMEYRFVNKSAQQQKLVFSFNSKNFLARDESAVNRIRETKQGFVLVQEGTSDKPQAQGAFAIFADEPSTVVDHCWFRGGWWDPLTMAWNHVRDGAVISNPPVEKSAPGASMYIPFALAPGQEKTIRVMMAWYVPASSLRVGEPAFDEKKDCDPASGCCASPRDLGIKLDDNPAITHYRPWYSSRFKDIDELADFWRQNYTSLLERSQVFSKAFYASTLPAEIMEAAAANLTILKSPTVLRQFDGRLWSWEGCGDDQGCCHGSCTHVWNYAQAISHLFPALERSLRHTEFCENQSGEGHQGFRANIPISPLKHDFYAAADGQLGGIMKVYREWRISGDSQWMERIFPMVKKSMDYCIRTWDPRGKGIVEEPHHNTYDIEFWGPNGFSTSFYLGALRAITGMGEALGKNMDEYKALYEKGKTFLEGHLFDGEYFIQDIEYKGLNAPDPATAKSYGGDYSKEAIALLQREGPKYQYGKGCLSDGILGAWMGKMCCLPEFIDSSKVSSHLQSVHRYNFKKDLSEHANPQRPAYALGKEGGLLLCTWPKGGKLSLPFVYSDEVWTGIEYQVASHLMLMGRVNEGLEIVRACRQRYDGRLRNPFNEYECGHWYARAMSSFGLIQGITGLRYDAVDHTLYVDSKIGDFTCFISTATGFGTVSFQNGKASLHCYQGVIDVKKWVIGKQTS